MRNFDIVIDRGKFIQHTIHRDDDNNFIIHYKTNTYLLKSYCNKKFTSFGIKLFIY